MRQLFPKICHTRSQVPPYLWRIKPILKCCVVSSYYFNDCWLVKWKVPDLGPTPPKRAIFLLKILLMPRLASWPSFMTKWCAIQNIVEFILYLVRVLILSMTSQLSNLFEIKNWISGERSMTFLRNDKILNVSSQKLLSFSRGNLKAL